MFGAPRQELERAALDLCIVIVACDELTHGRLQCGSHGVWCADDKAAVT